jgi:hypothetical protein
MAIYAHAYILYNNSEENLLQVYKNSPEILKKREEECLNFFYQFSVVQGELVQLVILAHAECVFEK